MIQVHGDPCSFSTRKVCWLLEELPRPYQLRMVDLAKGAHRTDAFRRLNPNCRVPVLEDGEFLLWEANAVLRYLADAYGSDDITGRDVRERATIQQWLDWQNSELGPALLAPWHMYYFARFGTPVDSVAHADAVERTRPVLAVLNERLEGASYLVGSRFTLADLAMAESVALHEEGKTPLDGFSHVARWLHGIRERPAFVNTREQVSEPAAQPA